MAERNFPHHSVRVDGKPRTVLRIECADCARTSDFHQTGNGRLPPIAAAQQFRRDGWVVGKGPRRDFCPKCVAKKSEKPKTSNIVEPPMPAPSPSQTQPRTMTRDDRRLIIAEVKGCYDEEKKRYMDGWHDERVAQSLGAHVPVAWVREVREDYFGEGGSNEQFDEFLRRLDAVDEDIARLKKISGTVNAGIEACQKAVEDMRPLSREVRRAIGK